jgi:hypothetical protein
MDDGSGSAQASEQYRCERVSRAVTRIDNVEAAGPNVPSESDESAYRFEGGHEGLELAT